MVMMVMQSGITKICTVLSQFVLMWVLMPEDFGLVVIAFMCSTIPELVRQGGLKEVLIQRHVHFRRWATPAFWMSICLGMAGGLLMAAAAPLVAKLYGEPRLAGLLWILAMQLPVDSLNVVPLAQLHGQMRFRLIAIVAFCQSAGMVVLSILMALVGFGPYSILLPRLLVAVGMAIFFWTLLRPPVRMKPQVRRWRFLFKDGWMVIAANGFVLLAHYTGYFVLSVLYAPAVVGLYSVAFNNSTQSIRLITQHMGDVLFPALSSIQHDPVRQVRAFLRALRVLACIAGPACLMQAALADPAIRALFREHWYGAIPFLQILSIGMAARAISWPANALLQAQGRFNVRMKISLISLLLLAVMVAIGVWLGGPTGVAIATTLQMFIIEPISVYLAIRPAGLGWADLRRVLAAPLAFAISVVGVAHLISIAVPDMPYRAWVQCLVVLAVAGLLFIPAMRILVPDAWAELKHRVDGLRRKTAGNAALSSQQITTSTPAS